MEAAKWKKPGVKRHEATSIPNTPRKSRQPKRGAGGGGGDEERERSKGGWVVVVVVEADSTEPVFWGDGGGGGVEALAPTPPSRCSINLPSPSQPAID